MCHGSTLPSLLSCWKSRACLDQSSNVIRHSLRAEHLKHRMRSIPRDGRTPMTTSPPSPSCPNLGRSWLVPYVFGTAFGRLHSATRSSNLCYDPRFTVWLMQRKQDSWSRPGSEVRIENRQEGARCSNPKNAQAELQRPTENTFTLR